MSQVADSHLGQPPADARCLRCGSNEFRPRALPREADIWVCNLCGEPAGPVEADPAPVIPEPAPAAKLIAISDFLAAVRPAAKLANVGPFVSRFAPLGAR